MKKISTDYILLFVRVQDNEWCALKLALAPSRLTLETRLVLLLLWMLLESSRHK
jgi:hypothetical protein